MLVRLVYIALLGGSLAMSGCAAQRAGEGGTFSNDVSVLTAAEIEERGVADQSLYDVIRLMRSNYLVFRGLSGTTANAGAVQVSFEGQSLMKLDDLRTTMGREVAEVRYLSAASAAQRFGTSANNGPVILVKRK